MKKEKEPSFFKEMDCFIKPYKKRYMQSVINLSDCRWDILIKTHIEYVKGIEVIKAFNMADNSYLKYKNAVTHHADYSINWMKSSQLYASLSYSIAPVSIFPAIVIGLLLLSKGSLTEHSFFLFMMISLGIFKPILKASSYVDGLAQMGTVAKEIKEILDYPEIKRNEKSILKKDMIYDISFSNLQFSYDGTKNDIDGVNLEIKEKTMTAVIGTSGSGKSTLMKLLAGFWDFEKGDIKIGNISIKDLSMNDLNALISYVDQNTFLFNDSIGEIAQEGTHNELIHQEGIYNSFISIRERANTWKFK